MSSIKKPDLYSFQERARVAIIFVGVCFGLLAVQTQAAIYYWQQIERGTVFHKLFFDFDALVYISLSYI